ncbi:contactin-3-like [Onychostoma macrolepis]|uniref:contactin-3-like n=1 Tax=Onychostoma macrolepis TaxID=369639 RepID=UPI00272D5552|nr:contactin-3-like [Onychostoma macrolepis]
MGYDYTSTMVFCLIALTALLVSPLKHLEAVELKEVKLGDTVALMCNLSFYSEIHWLRMSEGQPMALMATRLKHTGELSVVWNYNETHFEGFIEKQTTGLRILHVSTSDLATYYCATSYQNHLNFDKGVQLYIFSENQQSKYKPFDRVQGPDGLSLHYKVFIAVLCFGLLGMLVSVLVVHMKTRKKNNTSSNEE